MVQKPFGVALMINWLLEKNYLPDSLIRIGIRQLLKQRLKEENLGDVESQQNHLSQFVDELRQEPIAIHTDDANEQHYELPTAFFQLVLGPHLKYSSGYWKSGTDRLERAEEDMLALTCERAGLEDGMQILELGCGWGSLSMFMAARYPHARITSVSNSKTQKEYIDSECRRRNIDNLNVITADMNDFATSESFDRVISVEMFEHMRNYDALTRKINGWLNPGGKLFIHIFTHRLYAYPFEVRDETDWMARYFFTGGIMPSDHLMLYFNKSLVVDRHWVINGTHYGKTARAWLTNMDDNRSKVLSILESTYGSEQRTRWWVYWRLFFMACEELWSFRNGNEWFVSHYLFSKR